MASLFTQTFQEQGLDSKQFAANWSVASDPIDQRGWICAVGNESSRIISYFPSSIRIAVFRGDTLTDRLIRVNPSTAPISLFERQLGGGFIESASGEMSALYCHQVFDPETEESSYVLTGFARSDDVLSQLDPIFLADNDWPEISLALEAEGKATIETRGHHLAKIEVVASDPGGEIVPTDTIEISNFSPCVILDDVASGDVQIDGEMATVVITGEVFDPIADNFPRKPISEGGADIETVSIFVDNVLRKQVSVTTDPAYEQTHSSFWRQHAFRGTFQATLSLVAKETRIIVIRTGPNLAELTGTDIVWLHFTQMRMLPPYSLEGVQNWDGSPLGTYHPMLPRVTNSIHDPESLFFGYKGSISPFEEHESFYYPRGASTKVTVYSMRVPDEGKTYDPRILRKARDTRYRIRSITYTINDAGMIAERKVTDEYFTTTHHNSVFYIMSLPLHNLEHLCPPRSACVFKHKLVRALATGNPSIHAHTSATGNRYYEALALFRNVPDIGTLQQMGALPPWQITHTELVELSTELPGNRPWQKLIFMIDHWEDVRTACDVFDIPPEVFFATVFAEFGDNAVKNVIGEAYDAVENVLDWPKATGFGLANLPHIVFDDDAEYLGYSLHNAQYMAHTGVPQEVRQRFDEGVPKSRAGRITDLLNDRQLSIYIHAARMRAIADTLVSINPARFHLRDAAGAYDWMTGYISDGLSHRRSLSNFVMLAIEQGGFARVPDTEGPPDGGMIDVAHGIHWGTEKRRDNLAYVNVLKCCTDGDGCYTSDITQWKPEPGGNEHSVPYTFCTLDPGVECAVCYDNSLAEVLILFDVFRTSTLYLQGE